MKTHWREHESSPGDAAVAHFNCALSRERLLRTSDEEIALALSRRPRFSQSILATVYVLGNEANSLVKIGYADNLASRCSGINSGSPVAISLRHFVHVVDGTVAKRVEGEVHKALAEFRRRGEWFDVPVSRAAEAIGTVLLSQKLRWWTEQESRDLVILAKDYWRTFRQRERFFGT